MPNLNTDMTWHSDRSETEQKKWKMWHRQRIMYVCVCVDMYLWDAFCVWAKGWVKKIMIMHRWRLLVKAFDILLFWCGWLECQNHFIEMVCKCSDKKTGTLLNPISIWAMWIYIYIYIINRLHPLWLIWLNTDFNMASIRYIQYSNFG